MKQRPQLPGYVPLWKSLANKQSAVRRHVDECANCGSKNGEVDWRRVYMPHFVRPYPALCQEHFVNPVWRCRQCGHKTPFEMNPQFVDVVPGDEVRRGRAELSEPDK